MAVPSESSITTFPIDIANIRGDMLSGLDMIYLKSELNIFMLMYGFPVIPIDELFVVFKDVRLLEKTLLSCLQLYAFCIGAAMKNADHYDFDVICDDDPEINANANRKLDDIADIVKEIANRLPEEELRTFLKNFMSPQKSSNGVNQSGGGERSETLEDIISWKIKINS
jgi:hypothetical protein